MTEKTTRFLLRYDRLGLRGDTMAHIGVPEVVQQDISLSGRQQADHSFHPKNVLIVDDDSRLLFILQEAFRFYAKSYNVLTAKNGSEAIEVLRESPVDLVLTDLNMPLMNGYELLSYMGKNHPRIPVFVMTGDFEPEEVKKLRSSGMSQFINKPFSTFEVVRRIFDEFGDHPASSTIPTRADNT